MTNDNFNRQVEEALEKAKSVLIKKSGEYSIEEDRLSHFTKVALLLDCSEIQAAWYLASKHIISIAEMTEKPFEYSLDKWDEKILDLLNYMLLLRGIIIDNWGDDYE